MWFSLGTYLQPTTQLHELRILACLSENPKTSQAELARLVDLTPAMVNAYLRRLISEGLIERVPRSGRDFDYNLTSAGEQRRLYHVITFSAELYTLFDEVLSDLKKRIAIACGTKPCRVVIYGAGETGQMSYLAIRGLPNITLLGVVDDDPAKIGSMFFEHKIEPMGAITALRPDKIIVASWLHSHVMFRKLNSAVKGQGIEVVTLIS